MMISARSRGASRRAIIGASCLLTLGAGPAHAAGAADPVDRILAGLVEARKVAATALVEAKRKGEGEKIICIEHSLRLIGRFEGALKITRAKAVAAAKRGDKTAEKWLLGEVKRISLQLARDANKIPGCSTLTPPKVTPAAKKGPCQSPPDPPCKGDRRCRRHRDCAVLMRHVSCCGPCHPQNVWAVSRKTSDRWMATPERKRRCPAVRCAKCPWAPLKASCRKGRCTLDKPRRR